MNFAFIGTAALLVTGALCVLWHLQWMQRVPALADTEASALPVRSRCSIVIAARDEEARIEQTVRRLLAQRGVELELIVVDDRSSDRTNEILGRLAGEDSQLRVIRIDKLPEGWLGKCHACHVGANAATGEWILFTDADCWSKPDLLLRALRVAERERVDHVTVTSGVAVKSPGLRAGSLLFHLCIANWFSGVNRDRPGAHFGIGAFNLVRASAYRACGGYEALRLTVIDDLKLGLLLRRAGKRTRAFVGGDDVEAHWGTRLWDAVRLMEKNHFAALEFNLPLALGAGAFFILLMGLVVLGAVSRTGPGLAAALSPLCLVVPAAILARRIRWPWTIALGVPFTAPVIMVCSLLNSTLKTLWRGGIRWRETFYPLDALRAGRVR